MASQIILEHAVVRQHLQYLKLVSQQSDVAGRQCVPDSAHRCDVIEHVAFRLFRRSEIRHDFLRFHYDFAKQQYARAHDAAGKIHHAYKCVDLRQIAAVGTELLPYIRNGIEPDYIHSPVGQIQHVLSHVVEYHRVGIVQIPLERVERCHYYLEDVLEVRKAPRRSLREYLRHRLLEFIRDIPVVIEEVLFLRSLVSLAGSLRPFMVLTCVIHYKIKAKPYSSSVAGCR